VSLGIGDKGRYVLSVHKIRQISVCFPSTDCLPISNLRKINERSWLHLNRKNNSSEKMDIGNIKSYLSPKEFQILFNGILQVVKTQIDERNLLSNSQSSSDYELLVEKLKTLNQELDGNDVGNIIQAFEMVIANIYSPISFDLYFFFLDCQESCNGKLDQ
jgi:hypothetical protein